MALNGLRVVVIGAAESDVALEAYTAFGEGRHPAALNLGDCFAYACARVNRVTLLWKIMIFPTQTSESPRRRRRGRRHPAAKTGSHAGRGGGRKSFRRRGGIARGMDPGHPWLDQNLRRSSLECERRFRSTLGCCRGYRGRLLRFQVGGPRSHLAAPASQNQTSLQHSPACLGWCTADFSFPIRCGRSRRTSCSIQPSCELRDRIRQALSAHDNRISSSCLSADPGAPTVNRNIPPDTIRHSFAISANET